MLSCSVMSASMRPRDCSLPGSSAHGILSAGILDGLPCPRPVDLPDPGIEPVTPESPALTDGFFTTSTTWEAGMTALHNIGLIKKFIWFLHKLLQNLNKLSVQLNTWSSLGPGCPSPLNSGIQPWWETGASFRLSSSLSILLEPKS